MYRNILLPSDGTNEEAAIKHAFEIASMYDATLHALYIQDISTSSGDLLSASQSDSSASGGNRALTDIKNRATEEDIDVITNIREQIPHEGILEYAAEQDIDLVVMASRGRSGINRFLFGSVSEQVHRNTDIPILIAQRTDPESE